MLKLPPQLRARNRFALAQMLEASEHAEFPEPAQREPDLGSLQPMTTHESFDTDPLESGPLERYLHGSFR